MKILLIYPPDRAFPAVPYSSLPTLAPNLTRAGHEVVLRDISLEVFKEVMKEDVLLDYREGRLRRVKKLESKSCLNGKEEAEYRWLYQTLAIPERALTTVTQNIRLMQDPEQFYEPERFTQAWDDLRGAIRFYYGPNPIPSPNYPDLIDRVFRSFDRKVTDDPVGDVYRNGLIDSLLADQPDMIGLSIPFITSYYESMRLVHNLRQHAPDIPIVLGGSLIDTYYDPMITDPRLFDLFDYGMYGECDEALVKLVDTVENGGDLSGVPNLVYCDKEGTVHRNDKKSVEDLNSLPTPDFTGLYLDGYLSPEPIASFQTSRGCYYGKCTFCSLSFRDNFRLRDAESVVEDMTDIYAKTGTKLFLLWDSLSPPKTLRAVANAIKERDLGFHFFAETKFEKTYLRKDLLQDLGEGGCRFLQFGMESASERVLDMIDKGNKMSEVDVMLDNMAENGIHTSLTWFIGFPTETEEEARFSFDYIQHRRHKVTLSSYTGIYNLLPDQPLFYDQDTYGIKIHCNEDGGYYFTYQDGTMPFDPMEMDEAYLVRGDAELLKHGAYMLYATYYPEALEKLTGFYRMGPLLGDVADWKHSIVHRTAETTLTSFGRDPIKDFQAPPTSIQLVYHSTTGNVYRLLGSEMKVLNAAEKPTSVAFLHKELGMEWDELETILNKLVNRGVLRFIDDHRKNQSLVPKISRNKIPAQATPA